MEVWLLTVKSYTEAIRGRNFLQGEKISGRGGCTFAIRIKGDPNRASRLLGTIGVDVLKILEGRKK